VLEGERRVWVGSVGFEEEEEVSVGEGDESSSSSSISRSSSWPACGGAPQVKLSAMAVLGMLRVSHEGAIVGPSKAMLNGMGMFWSVCGQVEEAAVT
jgi:hypothetical protein